MTTPTIEALVQATEECEGPGLPLVARLYKSGRYRRATVDTTHHGVPLTYLAEAGEWRQKALLRKQMIEDLTAERDALSGQLAALRSLAASATQVPEHWKVVNEAQRAYGGIVKAAINLIAEVDERHDTKDTPLKHTVPYAAVVALRAAIEGFPPAPQAATQGEAVVWQRRSYLPGFGWSEWLPCSREAYFEIHYGKSAHVQARALGVINEPAPAPSKEQTNG